MNTLVIRLFNKYWQIAIMRVITFSNSRLKRRLMEPCSPDVPSKSLPVLAGAAPREASNIHLRRCDTGRIGAGLWQGPGKALASASG